jgi:hypothetical protein
MGPIGVKAYLAPSCRASQNSTAGRRPWAMARPYNERAQVNAGLSRWARQTPSFRVVHHAMVAKYPVAERALADYYRSRPELIVGDADADAAARRVLDLVYRSYFVFSSGTEF